MLAEMRGIIAPLAAAGVGWLVPYLGVVAAETVRLNNLAVMGRDRSNQKCQF
jgi:hypothetical protein